jgi:hypothetical protein
LVVMEKPKGPWGGVLLTGTSYMGSEIRDVKSFGRVNADLHENVCFGSGIDMSASVQKRKFCTTHYLADLLR